MSDGDFLSRWSRRKIAARRGEASPEPVPVVPAPVPSDAGIQGSPATPGLDSRLRGNDTSPLPLPPVESLTPESDFTPFMQPNVDGALRRTALKTLFEDPRFNLMDGLDVYIDDYSKPDPLPEGWLEKMNQVAHLGHHAPPAEPAEAVAAQDATAIEGGSAGESTPETQGDTAAPTTPAQDSASDESEPHSRS